MQDRTLPWILLRPGLSVATCGSEDQGRVAVRQTAAYEWIWTVDMLPDDYEPVIWGRAESLAAAMQAAETQCAEWPLLIPKAARNV